MLWLGFPCLFLMLYARKSARRGYGAEDPALLQ